MKKNYYFVFLFLNSFAFAQTAIQDEELSKILTKSSYEPNYFSLLFGLIVVLGLVYLTAIVYQKLINTKLTSSSECSLRPEIICSTSLGQNKNLFVVKVNNEHILLGSTQTNITYIKTLDDKHVISGVKNE